MAIVKRLVKGSALTYAELDGNFTDLDGRVTTLEGGADNQTLSLVGTDLAISGGNTVSLASLLDNTDAQTLTLVGNILSISGGNNVDLSGLGGGYTDADVNTHLNQSTAGANEVLAWDGSDYTWVAQTTGYGDANVDTHLNQSTATANQVLSWNGSDYAWVAQSSGGSTFDQDLNTTDSVTFAGITSTGGNTFSGGSTNISTNSTSTWPNHTAPLAIQNTGSNTVAFQMNVSGTNDIVIANNNGSFVVRNYDTSTDIITVNSTGTVTATAFVGDGSGLTNLPSGSSYTDSDVDTHLNTSTATSGQILSWNGADYAWIPDQGSLSLQDLTNVDSGTTPSDGQVLHYVAANNQFEFTTISGGSSYTDSDVDTHLNTSTATANQILSWTGSDYAWVADQTGGGGVLSLTGHEPAVNFDFTGDGSVFAADALDYAEFAGGESKTEASALASDSMRSSWSPISGAVYTNNQFGLYLMKGNANDALIEAVGGSVNGWGDTILFGNVNDDGTSARMTSGLGITGNQVYLRTDGTEGDIKIRNTNANGNGEIDLFMGTSSTLAAYSRIKLEQDAITLAGFEANVTISDNTLGDLEIKKGTLGVSDAWVIGIDEANTEASSLVTFNVDGSSIWSATASALTVNPTTTFNGAVNILGGQNLTVGTVGGAIMQVNGAGLLFGGATSDANTTTLTVTDPTAVRTITLPDASGTVALLSDISGGSYNDASVDTHLNTSTATTGQILSWNGSDYAWVADQTGAGGGTLTVTGYNPAVDYDIDASGTGGELNDGLEYGKLASGTSAATSTGALGSSSLIPSWTALTGSVYNDNRFGLNVVRGNGRDSQRVGVGLTPEGYGDTFVLGNIDNDGTNIKLFSGLGVSGPDVYLHTEADQAVISIDNDSTNGTIRINNNNSASEILLLSTGDITVTGNTLISGTLSAGVTTVSSLVVNDGTAAMVFEGDTADNFETTVTFTDPTVDNTITFPNASGNVAVNNVNAQTGQAFSWQHDFRSGSTQTVEIDSSQGFTAHDNIFIDNMSGGDEMTVVFTQAAGTATSMTLKDGDRSNVAIALQGTIGLNTSDVTIVKVLDTGTIKYAWVVAAF